MSFELRSTNDLVRIAAAGGGFILDAALRSTDDLVRIAAAASTHGARVTFSGLKLRSTDDLVRISAAGKGAVMLEG
jgi:DNA replication protein